MTCVSHISPLGWDHINFLGCQIQANVADQRLVLLMLSVLQVIQSPPFQNDKCQQLVIQAAGINHVFLQLIGHYHVG